MNLRYLAAASLLTLTLGTGCVRRTTTQDFGLPTRNAPARPQRPATLSPDASLRTVFKRQTQGALNPLGDDPRVRALQDRLTANPQDIAVRLELGSVFESYRLYDNAFAQYLAALRLPPAGHAADASADQAVLGLSRSARASRRMAEAIPLLEAVLKERPAAGTWNELGLLYQESHDLAASERAFQETVARTPESDRAHNSLGYNLLLQGKPEAAEREFRKALDLNPVSATARNNLGTLLARRGDSQGALEQFQMAADAATAHNNLAVVLLEMEQYERSREELVKALAIRHYFAPALANFKLVQERMRERAEAQKFGRLPLSVVRVPTAVVALGDAVPSNSDVRSPDQREAGGPKESKDLGDRQ
jgi:tetratricopeptide (TPR) repeat protein